MSDRRRIRALAGVLGVLVLLGGCSFRTTVDGSGTASGLGTRSPSGPSALIGGAQPGATKVAAGSRAITALLETPPPGSMPWTSAWGAVVNPTPTQLVDRLYTASYQSEELALLTTQGLTDVANRTWLAADGNQCDTVLLRFAASDGAVSRYLVLTAGKTGASGYAPLQIPGYPAIHAYYRTTMDSLGYIRSAAYGVAGNVVMELYAYTTARLDQADVIAWAVAQYRKM